MAHFYTQEDPIKDPYVAPAYINGVVFDSDEELGATKPELVDLSMLQNSQIRSVIINNSNLEQTPPTFGENDLKDSFSEQGLDTKDDVAAAIQARYNAGLDKLGAVTTGEPEKSGKGYVMVGGSAESLKHAKALGMTTVLIDPDFTSENDIPDDVDVVANKISYAINCILDSNNHHLANTHGARIGSYEDPDLYGVAPV